MDDNTNMAVVIAAMCDGDERSKRDDAGAGQLQRRITPRDLLDWYIDDMTTERNRAARLRWITADVEIVEALMFYADHGNWLIEEDNGDGYINRIEWNASGDLWRAPWKRAEQALARAV